MIENSESGYVGVSDVWNSDYLKSMFLEDYNNIVMLLQEDYKNYDKNNTDEDVVLNSNFFSIYNGKTVLRHYLGMDGATSCAIFETIFLNIDEEAGDKSAQDTVKHEYGHTVQEELLGDLGYILKIAIPSLTNRNPVGINYYSQLWERGADVYGGLVNRTYSDNVTPYVYSNDEQAAVDYMNEPSFSSFVNKVIDFLN